MPVFLPTFSHAAQSGYELLVQRNLELREKIGVLEQKYTELENERNVLIGHVRDLQQEKERFVNARGSPPVDESRYARIETAVKEVSDQLSVVTGEKVSLEKELAKTKEILEEGQAKVKTLEQENAALNEQLERIKEELDKREALKKTTAAPEDRPGAAQGQDRSMTKDLAIELAFARAREAGLMARHQSALAGSDQLRADVQRLTRVNEALKNTEKKWRQADHDLDVARAGSRKMEAMNKKLENKLARMDILKTRARKNEEELQALRMLQKEHEAMIRKLTSEKTALEARLARMDAPGGAASAAYARRKNTISPADKQRLDMHFNLAVAYDKTKMYKAEEREYMECLRLDPRDASVHYNLGILYDDKLKNHAKAIKHYQEYLRLRPTGEDSEQVKEWIMHAEQQQRL
ncbi:MAG: tetratricopeptide repeat protein [Candidatus Omnitrophica bacterium]|nr:tetratricopeptide repeat protein [Candidatus Omnitrophota bacterium]